MSLKYVSAKITMTRIQAGFTMPYLASKAGISKGNLSKIENHSSNLSVGTLLKLAKALRVHPATLLPK